MLLPTTPRRCRTSKGGISPCVSASPQLPPLGRPLLATDPKRGRGWLAACSPEAGPGRGEVSDDNASSSSSTAARGVWSSLAWMMTYNSRYRRHSRAVERFGKKHFWDGGGGGGFTLFFSREGAGTTKKYLEWYSLSTQHPS